MHTLPSGSTVRAAKTRTRTCGRAQPPRVAHHRAPGPTRRRPRTIRVPHRRREGHCRWRVGEVRGKLQQRLEEATLAAGSATGHSVSRHAQRDLARTLWHSQRAHYGVPAGPTSMTSHVYRSSSLAPTEMPSGGFFVNSGGRERGATATWRARRLAVRTKQRRLKVRVAQRTHELSAEQLRAVVGSPACPSHANGEVSTAHKRCGAAGGATAAQCERKARVSVAGGDRPQRARTQGGRLLFLACAGSARRRPV